MKGARHDGKFPNELSSCSAKRSAATVNYRAVICIGLTTSELVTIHLFAVVAQVWQMGGIDFSQPHI
jgi:hypothetical protein